MKIYLILLDDERFIFYSEGPETIVELIAPIQRRGVRGWVERKYKSLQVTLNESEKGVGLRMRRIWEWLQKRIPPDEPILRSLRGARTLTLYHTPSFEPEVVSEKWNRYLKERQSRHMFWFVANAIVSPLTLLLAPLPGPNLIGYWFVYRAVCHLLARLGARHARSERVETVLSPISDLEGLFAVRDEERISHLSTSYGLVGLGVFLERMTRGNKRKRRKTPLPAS